MIENSKVQVTFDSHTSKASGNNSSYRFSNDYYEVVQNGLKIPANDNRSVWHKKIKNVAIYGTPVVGFLIWLLFM